MFVMGEGKHSMRERLQGGESPLHQHLVEMVEAGSLGAAGKDRRFCERDPSFAENGTSKAEALVCDAQVLVDEALAC